MFYTNQTKEMQDLYRALLEKIGSLTKLFSESDCPYLPYRAQENIFCYSFGACNVGREDCSVDAKKGTVGIGLKTWTGSNDQKTIIM